MFLIVFNRIPNLTSLVASMDYVSSVMREKVV